MKTPTSCNTTDLPGGRTSQTKTPPVWIRPPKVGLEPHTCLSRAMLYQLAQEGLIETRTIVQPGKHRGVRLFRLGSILEFLERCPEFVTNERKEAA
jgi:hypothetical protein